MKTFRKFYRILLMLPWLLYMALESLPVTLRRKKYEAVSGMALKVRKWGKGLMKIFNIHIHCHGENPLAGEKREGMLIVSNHLGYVDVFVHGALFGIRFAPKAEIRKWPLLGLYTSFVHPVWVDRSSKMKSKKCVEEFRATLENGVPLIVYPEGTSTEGKEVLPFKSSLFDIVTDGKSRILPVVTRYRVEEGEDTPCWFGDISMGRHLWDFLGIKRIDADIYILPPVQATTDDRKVLACQLQEQIADALKILLAGGDPLAEKNIATQNNQGENI